MFKDVAVKRSLITDTEEAISFLSYLITTQPEVIACDTETYGLLFTDKYFSIQFSYLCDEEVHSCYINCKLYPEEGVHQCVDKERITELLKTLFSINKITFVFANPKFDMHKLYNEHGMQFLSTIYDVQTIERIIFNLDMSYSLASVAKKYGYEKDSRVEDYIKEHRLLSKVTIEGKETEETNLHYDRVPLSLMFEYGCKDTEITLYVYYHQQKIIEQNGLKRLVDINNKLNVTVFRMEQKGIRVNVPFIKEQIVKLEKDIESHERMFHEMTSHKFDRSAEVIARVMFEQGITLPLTMTGKYKTDADTLEGCNNAVSDMILTIRDFEKRLSTYYTILRYQVDGVIHCNFKLSATKTLRLSCTEPNLQNIESDEKGATETLRSAFIPREGKAFLSIDYKAMEYCIAADVAMEQKWVTAIMGGADPHQWVADNMNATRTAAKTINFLNLYGGGLAALAMKLFASETNMSQTTLHAIYMVRYLRNCPFAKPEQIEEVKRLPPDRIEEGMSLLRKADEKKQIYTNALPKVMSFIKDAKRVALSRGYLKNFYGMRYHCPDELAKSWIVNHLIQGTGGCVVRDAMNQCDDLLLNNDSAYMLLQIHDELLFEVDADKLMIYKELLSIMENIYEPNCGMVLRCDAEYSTDSWNSNTFKNCKELV